MSKDKKSKGWAMWVEKTSNALVNNPEIYRLLPPLILDLAVREDMTGPLCRGVVRNDYLNRLVDRLREPVARAIRDAGVSVSTERLTEICQCAAGETFVIRTLNEARFDGEISIKDLQDLPFFATYRNYFEMSSDIITKSLEIWDHAAQQHPRIRGDSNPN